MGRGVSTEHGPGRFGRRQRLPRPGSGRRGVYALGYGPVHGFGDAERQSDERARGVE